MGRFATGQVGDLPHDLFRAECGTKPISDHDHGGIAPLTAVYYAGVGLDA
jgi:hypothetical protein